MIVSLARDPSDGRPVLLIGMTSGDLERLVGQEQPFIKNLARIVPDQDIALPDATLGIYFASEEAVEWMRQRFGEGRAPQNPSEGEPRNDHDSSNGDGPDRQPRTRADAREQRRRRRGW